MGFYLAIPELGHFLSHFLGFLPSSEGLFLVCQASGFMVESLRSCSKFFMPIHLLRAFGCTAAAVSDSMVSRAWFEGMVEALGSVSVTL